MSAIDYATQTITLFKGNTRYLVPVQDLCCIEADHVYVKVHATGNRTFMQRASLSAMLNRLPAFIQTHRSFAVNMQYVNRWDKESLYVGDAAIPISRSRRKSILSLVRN